MKKNAGLFFFFFFFLIVGLYGLTVIIQTALLRLEFHGALLEKKKKKSSEMEQCQKAFNDAQTNKVYIFSIF